MLLILQKTNKMKKLEELKSMSSFKKESDDFLRKVVGGDSIQPIYSNTNFSNGTCGEDVRALTICDDCDGSSWDGALKPTGYPCDARTTK